MNEEACSGSNKKKIHEWQLVGFIKSKASSKGYREAVSFNWFYVNFAFSRAASHRGRHYSTGFLRLDFIERAHLTVSAQFGVWFLVQEILFVP
jgi:hypothetical protein